MRVLHLLDVCPRGGAETLVLDLLRRARSRPDLECHVVLHRGGVLETELMRVAKSGVRIGRRLPVDPISVYRLRRRMVANKIQVLHTHGSVDLLHGSLACCGTGVRHVHSLHGYEMDVPWKNRLIDQILLPRVDAALAVSQAVLEHYRDLGMLPVGSRVVENAVDAAKLEADVVDLRRELAWPGEAPLMGMVGNFVNNVRDQGLVCDALVKLSQRGRDFRFVFVGRGSQERPEILRACKEKIQSAGLDGKVAFLGGRSDVPGILRALDVFVYASHHDTFGIAVVEAMFAGIPVVVNDLAPFRVIGREGEDLDLYPTGNVDALVHRLESFLDDRPRYQELARKGQLRAHSHYEMDRLLHEMQSVYQEMCDEG